MKKRLCIIKILLVIFLIFILSLDILSVAARGNGHSSNSHPTKSVHSKISSKSSSNTEKHTHKATVAAHHGHGHIKRSENAKHEFLKQTGHPKGWKGHVVDHIVPLECGGADSPSNMQWQTTEAAKIKDKTERNCRR